jgi:hypothetical protein
VVALSSLGACSGLRPYANDAHQNLRVRTVTQTGAFSSVRVKLHLAKGKTACEATYEGTIDLDKSERSVGIPVGQPTYLGFAFITAGLFSGESAITQHVLLTPRAGYNYVAEVSYQDAMYNVVLREFRDGSTSGREIDSRPVTGCAS